MCLFKTYSEFDVWQLQKIINAMDEKEPIPEVPNDFLLRTFEGQTVFSITLAEFEFFEHYMNKL